MRHFHIFHIINNYDIQCLCNCTLAIDIMKMDAYYLECGRTVFTKTILPEIDSNNDTMGISLCFPVATVSLQTHHKTVCEL